MADQDAVEATIEGTSGDMEPVENPPTDDAHVLTPDADESVLETLDSCVGYVKGLEQQNAFEAGLDNLQLVDRGFIPSYQTLSEPEAALVRLQIQQSSETNATQQAASLTTMGTLPNIHIDLLNICGTEDDIDDAKVFPLDSSNATAAGTKETDNAIHSVQDGKETNVSSEEAVACAVCFDEAADSSKHITFANLPCCGHSGTEETTTTKICTACILVLTSPTSDGASRIGRCPRCRSWIVVQTPQSADDFQLEITAVKAAGKCLVCNQVKEYLVEDESVCDACFLGRRHPLLYECQQCRVTQRIPHPMYRYQDKPDEFGNVTWACQGRCGTFTKWRIRQDQLRLVPVGDAPDAWGQDFMTTARARVQEARQELSENNHAEGVSSSCTIM